jgi:hypothetical protein
MNALRISLAFLCLTVPVIAGEAVPGEAVKAAVQKLSAAPNYSFRMTTTTGGDSRFMPGPVEGRTVKGGCTRWVMTFGEHRVDAFVKNGQVAVKTEEGWTKQEDRKPPPGIGPPPPPSTAPSPPPPREGEGRVVVDSRKDPEGRKEGHRKGSKEGFLARRLQSMKAPAEVAADLAGKVTGLKTDGDGISGDLTPAAALELLTFGAHRREGGGPPEPVNPRGSVKYWLKDGAIQKMEVRLAATIPINGSEVAIDRTTVVEISNVGTTQVEVPAEAQKLLETENPSLVPSPQPAKKPV